MTNSDNLYDGELFITSNENGKIWNGKPFSILEIDWKETENSDDIIVLLDFYKTDINKHRNLIRLNHYSKTIWGVTSPRCTSGGQANPVPTTTRQSQTAGFHKMG